MTDRLDALLSQPLEDIADNGFSARVLTNIGAKRQRDTLWTYLVLALAALPLLFLLPFPEIGATLAGMGPALAASAPLSLACGVLIITMSFETLIRQS